MVTERVVMERDGRSTRWAEHRQKRRRTLVDASLQAIRLRGAGVGMDEIAAVAGTSKTAFYRHFADRSGLHAAITARVLTQILHDVTTAVAKLPSNSVTGQPAPRAMVHVAITAYLTLVEKDPEVYRFVVTSPSGERSVAPAADSAMVLADAVAVPIGELLAQKLAALGGDPGPAPVWASGVVGMVQAAADAWLRSEPRRSRVELAELLTNLAWSGLSPGFEASAPALTRPPRDEPARNEPARNASAQHRQGA